MITLTELNETNEEPVSTGEMLPGDQQTEEAISRSLVQIGFVNFDKLNSPRVATELLLK